MTKNRGFTLIELMIVLAVIVILVTVAIPNFGPFVRDSQMDALQNRLVTSISLARMEAIKQGVDVTVCPRDSSNVNSCGSRWGNGWSVIASSAALRVEDAPASTITISGTNTTFESSGFLNINSAICFTVDDGETDTDVRYVQVTQFGRVRAWDGATDDTVCGSGS